MRLSTTLLVIDKNIGHSRYVGQVRYQDLAVLVADDFSSFRSTVNTMLMNLGVIDVEMASNGEEVIEKCGLKSYDVVLCDYDLGPGRNGQHVLEELRHNKLISPTSVFIMVSAEASRNIVMSAYDCEPDDYLMKPITGMMLEQRMHRLLTQKEVLRPIFSAIKKGEIQIAVDMLIDLSLAEDRHSVPAQKLLGDVFIKTGELRKAEKLYKRALEVRQVDWARLGLAYVKQLQGDLDTARDYLHKIVEENPLYLPAYDVLADNWNIQGDKQAVQDTVEKAVDVSPMSILRQKRLAKVANENEDAMTAVSALRKTIKLGKLSCFGEPEDSFELARTVSNALEKDLELPSDAVNEALTVLESVKEEFDLSDEEASQIDLLQGRVLANDGNVSAARQCLRKTELDLFSDEMNIDLDVDRVTLLLSTGENDRAEELLEFLQEKYAEDQSALEKLDQFLAEPASESNRELVAEVNREGIDLYSVGEFDKAIEFFERARKLFPKHIGIQLNIVQSLIGKLKEDADNDYLIEECQKILMLVDEQLDKHHPQFGRFSRLRRRFEVFLR